MYREQEKVVLSCIYLWTCILYVLLEHSYVGCLETRTSFSIVTKSLKINKEVPYSNKIELTSISIS